MSWSVIITDRFKDGSDTVVRAVFTDSVSQKIPKEFRLSNWDLNSFKSICQSQISAFSNQGNVSTDLPLGAFDPTITAPVPSALDLYSADVQLLKQMKRAVDLGVLDPADKSYVDQLAKVKSGYLAAFIGAF